MSKIPVFVSCPTKLNAEQETYNQRINRLLDEFGLERRALGRSDYPLENPLKEVYVLAKHCAGGIILGFEQTYVEKGIIKRNTDESRVVLDAFPMPSPWNHLEAGILYGLKLPLLIIKEAKISGGIFDIGASSLFVHEFTAGADLRQVFAKWFSQVYKTYYME